MHVTIESTDVVADRLLCVLRNADFHVLPGSWIFSEFSSSDFTAYVNQQALALVRDGERWSQLVPAERASQDAMLVFSFHFETGVNNSGFVGWLASAIKARTGSGVAVICGQNCQRGGIFDYWCCPATAKTQILELIYELKDIRQDA